MDYILFFHFLGKKSFVLRIKYFSLSWKKRADYIFFTFWKKSFILRIIYFSLFWKKMAKRIKFSDDILSDYFQMTTQFDRKSRKFATTSTVYNVEKTPFPENMIEEPLTFCQELFDRIVDELKERSDVKADDMIRVTVSHPRLDMPICCPFIRAEALTGENIVGKIERVMQSNTDCDISDGDMSVEFTHTVLPSVSGGVKQAEYDNTESMRKNKLSIVRIQNATDLTCLARSIVVGMCHVHRSDTPEWKKEWRAIRTFEGPLQKTRAE